MFSYLGSSHNYNSLNSLTRNNGTKNNGTKNNGTRKRSKTSNEKSIFIYINLHGSIDFKGKSNISSPIENSFVSVKIPESVKHITKMTSGVFGCTTWSSAFKTHTNVSKIKNNLIQQIESGKNLPISYYGFTKEGYIQDRTIKLDIQKKKLDEEQEIYKKKFKEYVDKLIEKSYLSDKYKKSESNILAKKEKLLLQIGFRKTKTRKDNYLKSELIKYKKLEEEEEKNFLEKEKILEDELKILLDKITMSSIDIKRYKRRIRYLTIEISHHSSNNTQLYSEFIYDKGNENNKILFNKTYSRSESNIIKRLNNGNRPFITNIIDYSLNDSSLIILHDSIGNLESNIQFQKADETSTQELINLLAGLGYTHIYLIDSSCNNLSGYETNEDHNNFKSSQPYLKLRGQGILNNSQAQIRRGAF